MNAALLVAAFLLVAIGVSHSYLGERFVLIRLFRRSDLPRLFGSDAFTRTTLRFAWHITTIAWLGFAALLVAAARSRSDALGLPALGAIVATTFFISGVISGVASRGRHYSWIVFLAIGILAWIGTR